MSQNASNTQRQPVLREQNTVKCGNQNGWWPRRSLIVRYLMSQLVAGEGGECLHSCQVRTHFYLNPVLYPPEPTDIGCLHVHGQRAGGTGKVLWVLPPQTMFRGKSALVITVVSESTTSLTVGTMKRLPAPNFLYI